MAKSNSSRETKKTSGRMSYWTKNLRVFPVLLILLGLIFLLQSTGILPGAIGKLWPLLILAIGLVILYNGLHKDD